ncbi:MAG TPA: hypothetical protein VF039_10440 [Longimicrobiales bacterium]
MTRTFAVASCALVALLGCVSAPANRTADPVGCWYFERDEHAAALNLPWGVRLLGDALQDAPAHGDARAARTLEATGEAGFPFGFWAPIAGDSIVIGYPAGGGLLLRLAGGDTSMHGIARPVGDVIAPGATARPDRPVQLSRAQCPEEAAPR